MRQSEITILGHTWKCSWTSPTSVDVFVTEMYEAPRLDVGIYGVMRAVSEHFGTNAIDIDDYHVGGCETCDYGSAYGHVLHVKNTTKNCNA